MEPTLPDGWIALAAHFYRYTMDLEKALSAINLAVTKATVQGNFVRHAHLERVRIAIALKAYHLAEESLSNLIEYIPARESLDVNLEADFLTALPHGLIDERLVRTHTEILNPESQAPEDRA